MGSPIDEITVTIEGEEYTAYRDEMLKNEELRELLLLFDSINRNLDDVNVEFLKLKHAQTSVRMTLQQIVVEFIKRKFKLSPAEADQPKETMI